MTSPVLTQALEAHIREAGGIVHSDGNIFFTNAEKFQRAAIASLRAAAPGVPTDRQLAAGALFPQVNGFSASPAAPAAMEGQQDARDDAFLAARLRRLFAHFAYPLPDFARDDARLIGIAGSAIGALLTRWETERASPAVAPSAQPVHPSVVDLLTRMRDRLFVLAMEDADTADQADACALAEEADALIQQTIGAAPSAQQPQAAGVSERWDEPEWKAFVARQSRLGLFSDESIDPRINVARFAWEAARSTTSARITDEQLDDIALHADAAALEGLMGLIKEVRAATTNGQALAAICGYRKLWRIDAMRSLLSTTSAPAQAEQRPRAAINKETPAMTTPHEFLALRDDACGSAPNCNLWYGASLEDAGAAWRELSENGAKEVYLCGWNAGTIASHEDMRWRFGSPRGTFACQICGTDSPHQHAPEVVAFHRDTEAHLQRERERRWEAIEALVARIAARVQGEAAQQPPAPAAPGVPTADKQRPLNGIPANWYHGEGAYAQCYYCRRYSLDPKTLGEDRYQPVCECGEKHGWSGSFKKPGPDAKWSGAAPGVPADAGREEQR